MKRVSNRPGPGGRKNEERKQSDKMETDEYRLKLGDLRIIEPVPATDEDLGCGPLIKIMPDTWQNISWVIQNGFQVSVDHNIMMRRKHEELKEYSLNSNEKFKDVVLDLSEQATKQFAKIKQDTEEKNKELTNEFK